MVCINQGRTAPESIQVGTSPQGLQDLAKQSQKYYKEILLEKVREEIGETGKLSVHTYMALKKAMYKPAAFFKGLLFPLCEASPKRSLRTLLSR